MRRLPGVTGASGMAIGPVAAVTLTGKMPVGGAAPRGTWLKIARRPRGF